MNKVYSKNTEGRDFVIGDLHGCFDLFNSILGRISFDGKIDRIFSVGDLIDRGSNSFECLCLIKLPWFHAVRGNHEDLLIKSVIHGEDTALWDMNGGIWHHEVDTEKLLALANKASELPLSITIENDNGSIGICHAQPPSLDWKDVDTPSKIDEQVMIWARSWITDREMDDVENISATFHGHTPVNDVVQLGNVHFIDTGAVFTGKLTCIQI